MKSSVILAALSLSLCAACPSPSVECQQDADCRAEEVCHQAICRQVCNASTECRRDEMCLDGVCLPAVFDAYTIDVAMADRAETDSALGDGARPDGASADGAAPDRAMTDTMATDAASRDAGPHDRARSDSAAHDAPSPDALQPDARQADSATPDALGACLRDEDCVFLNAPCSRGRCVQAQSNCVAEPDPGASCDDGFDCTEEDHCDEQGRCAGIPSDARCGYGAELCRPGCFAPPSGCGLAPAPPTLSCAAPVDDMTGATSICTLDFGEALLDQRDCLSCAARGGFVLLEHSDFLDAQGSCSLDGWTLEDGNRCTDTVASCAPSSALDTCCAEINSICELRTNDAWLKSEMGTNCGGGHRQWRITRSFDLSGLDLPTFCYDVSESYATSDDAVFATVERAGEAPVQLSCTSGSVDWRAGFQTSCAVLPAWAADHPAVQVTLAAHSSATNEPHRMRLDNLYLYGHHSSCAPASVLLLDEDFTGCEDPIVDRWNGWAVTGEARCSTAGCDTGGESAFARDGASFTLTHYLDTREVSGAVQLCLRAGDEHGTSSDGVAVAIDVGDGAGWRMVGWGSIYQARDNDCQQVCFNLSAQDPRVARNPHLGIRVYAVTEDNGRKSIVDDILVHGVRSCDVYPAVSVTALSEVGLGIYQLEVTRTAQGPPVVELTCAWGEASPSIEAITEIDYR